MLSTHFSSLNFIAKVGICLDVEKPSVVFLRFFVLYCGQLADSPQLKPDQPQFSVYVIGW